jgi:23S rRNA (adenine2503-C2)-methyltransferase
MSNLPEALRKVLSEKLRLFSSFPGTVLEDRDGTVKEQIILEDGNRIEAVILSDIEGRKTACISTQAGCAGACRFCRTGALGFKRNLKAGEIIEEFLFLKHRDPKISHIVIMGMGEPLLNLEELRKALEFISGEGIGISKKRITLSTAGITQGIRDLADGGPDIRLALSLTSGQQHLREKLMPFALTNPLSSIKESLAYYQEKQKHRITLEAVLLQGINTSKEEAKAIAEFAEGLRVVINLIPWNPVEGLSLDGKAFVPPSVKETAFFVKALEKQNLKVTLRIGKGRGITGACGQLGSDKQ